jgi:hypothetical protein
MAVALHALYMALSLMKDAQKTKKQLIRRVDTVDIRGLLMKHPL